MLVATGDWRGPVVEKNKKGVGGSAPLRWRCRKRARSACWREPKPCPGAMGLRACAFPFAGGWNVPYVESVPRKTNIRDPRAFPTEHRA